MQSPSQYFTSAADDKENDQSVFYDSEVLKIAESRLQVSLVQQLGEVHMNVRRIQMIQPEHKRRRNQQNKSQLYNTLDKDQASICGLGGK